MAFLDAHLSCACVCCRPVTLHPRSEDTVGIRETRSLGNSMPVEDHKSGGFIWSQGEAFDVFGRDMLIAKFLLDYASNAEPI